MNDFKNKLLEFMTGRYGSDELNKLLLKIAVISMVVSFFGIGIFNKISLIFLILYILRLSSKNYNSRYRENQLYLKYKETLTWKIDRFKKKRAYKKSHKIFKCKKCGKKLSVPKGKGKIEISCPCGNKFTKKT